MFRTKSSPRLRFIQGKSRGSQRALENSVLMFCFRFVLTDMGIAAATGAGIDLPETSGGESAKKIMEVISSATRESMSGKFLDVDTREEIPW
jgi:hypothetical protein